jgi:hypothetical protein
MAGVFAPPKKYRLGSAGGKGKRGKAGGTALGLAVSSMLAKGAPSASENRPSMQAKHAFGSGSYASVSGRAIAAMERTARRAPEVMVRITGRQHGGGHVLANFTYISRLGHGPDKELALYTSDGDVLRDGRDMQILAQDWQEWELGDDARRKGATSISMILSMPAGTDTERLREAALDFAAQEFANRSWVAALHTDRDHPHVHLTFARRDHDGRRFHPDRDDLFRYRQRFAEKLRDRGIEANATPARARGIDPTHEPIAAKKVREKGEVPRIDKSRADRAQRFRDKGVADPVSAVLTNQRATVLTAYERSITELSSSPSFADQVIARSLVKFIGSMPVPEPNSIKSLSPERSDPAAGDRSGSPLQSSGDVVEALDPLSAALARASAMADRLAERGPPTGVDEPSRARESQEQPSAVSVRLRGLIEQAQQPEPENTPDIVYEVIRRTQERERVQRERDRSRDRDGPRR